MGVECREAHQAQAPQAAGSAQSRQPLNRRARILARVRSVLLTALWFMPGAFFIAIGLSVAFAPQLLMSAVAGFCVFFGFASFGLAWKFIQLKNRVEKVAQSFETRIMVQAIPHGKLADPEERVQDLGTVQTKKILFH
jgi:membrane protein implicated in regulation of membrane protease activity